MVRKRPIFVPLAATAILVTLVAWLSSGAGGGGAERADETVAVERRAFASTVTALGAVKPRIGAEVRVGSRISGRVSRLAANVGDHVVAGQVIAQLETADLDAIVAQRRAEQKLAVARLRAIDALAPAEEAKARADIDRFAATAKLAADELDRQQALLRARVTTEAELQAARERHTVAGAQLESSRRALQLVQSGTTEQRRQAEADFERATAALRSAEVDRAFALIKAPISGVIASVATQEGETVAAGLSAPTFVTIVDLARLQVNAFVDEVDIGKVSVGQSVTFTVDAFPARELNGRVSAIYPSATIQDNVVKYVVAVDLTDGSGTVLRPEMTASVRIRIQERTVLAIPARAVRRADGASVAYVLTNGRMQARALRLGWRDGPWVEVVDGLKEGERVLVDPPASGRTDSR